jgi:hypothetical protein
MNFTDRCHLSNELNQRLMFYHLVFLIFLSIVIPQDLNAQQASNSLQIISPTDGTVVSPGSPLTVSVALNGGINITKAAVIAEEIGIYGLNIANSTATITFTIPSIAAGPKLLTAMGSDSSGNIVFSSSIKIDIEPNGYLTAINLDYKTIKFDYPGQQISLNATGMFLDGTHYNMSRSLGTTYTSNDPTVASVDRFGMVTAVGHGNSNTTQIVVQNGNISTTVSVYVPTTIPGDLNANGIIDQDDLNVILTYLNRPASGTFDARDLNHDGVIDLSDAQAEVSLCNKPCVIPNSGTDKIPPVTTATPSSVPSVAGWNSTNLSIILTASDNLGGSGVKEIHYTIGTNPPVVFSGAMTGTCQ